jgi:hypothetical protein
MVTKRNKEVERAEIQTPFEWFDARSNENPDYQHNTGKLKKFYKGARRNEEKDLDFDPSSYGRGLCAFGL